MLDHSLLQHAPVSAMHAVGDLAAALQIESIQLLADVVSQSCGTSPGRPPGADRRHCRCPSLKLAPVFPSPCALEGQPPAVEIIWLHKPDCVFHVSHGCPGLRRGSWRPGPLRGFRTEDACQTCILQPPCMLWCANGHAAQASRLRASPSESANAVESFGTIQHLIGCHAMGGL